jgi:hypothetical protein
MNRQNQANDVLGRIGVTGESGIDVSEAMNSGVSKGFDDLFCDTVPGASLLVRRHRRVVLVSDRFVYLLAGTIKRPGSALGIYELGPDVMKIDGEVLTFPDGQSVRVTRFQAQSLLQAAGGSFGRQLAEKVTRNAGEPGGRVVAFGWGTAVASSKKEAVDRIADGLLDGDWNGARHEKRFVVVSDTSVLVARDGRPDQSGAVLAVIPLGVILARRDEVTIAFGDDHAVRFTSPSEADHLYRAATGSMPVAGA